MKTDNRNNFRLVQSAFIHFCEENDLKPYTNPVYWEHDGFSCSAENQEGDIVNFRAVDSECFVCMGETDYCFNCKSHNGVGFEEV